MFTGQFREREMQKPIEKKKGECEKAKVQVNQTKTEGTIKCGYSMQRHSLPHLR